MKSIKDRLAEITEAGDGPSPLEYSVIVALLVVASLTLLSSSQHISNPYISRAPTTTAR